MRNARLDEAEAGIKTARRNINNLRYICLMVESEELKSLLMKVKEESEKVELKSTFTKLRLWFQSHHFMENRWESNENSDRLYFGGSKITADGGCSHENKRRLLLGRKIYDQTTHNKKQRHYLTKKGLSSQGYGFSCGHVWM